MELSQIPASFAPTTPPLRLWLRLRYADKSRENVLKNVLPNAANDKKYDARAWKNNNNINPYSA